MNFLQPFLLVALPLIALPLIIHLINQRRFQTIRWGAMMFLLAAQRMSRGYSRIRQWLIMLFRMLAIAGLILAISRPLSSGWLGRAAGLRAETTLILLDRSPSMGQHGPGTTSSKLETGCRQLVQTLGLLESSQWILIESTRNKPQEIDSPEALLNLSAPLPTDAAADLPGMLETALDYIQANKTARTEIWICSDLRTNDWNRENGRWQGLRDAFQSLPQQVRIHLLAYPQNGRENASLRVTDVRRQEGEHPELLVTLKVHRNGTDLTPLKIPLQFEIDGVRSVVEAEISGNDFELKNHRIPLAQNQKRGWGTVSIPADVNPSDNIFYLAYAPPPERRALIVSEDEAAILPLRLSASVSPDLSVKSTADIVTPARISTVDWEKTGTLLWQAQLPEGESATLVQDFVNRGGHVLFFPPKSPNSTSFSGVRWDQWVESREDLRIDNWLGDDDLLTRTQSGVALPAGQVTVRRYCTVVQESRKPNDNKKNEAVTTLATLVGGLPLLMRKPTDKGGIYFCATTSSLSNSSLSTNGVVLYVMIQRALAAGAESLKSIHTEIAGRSETLEADRWVRLSGSENAVPAEFPFHGGIYSLDDKIIVINRSPEEDAANILNDKQLRELFQGLDFSRVDDTAGNLKSLIQEIWRFFMALMIVALVVEAALCLPVRDHRIPGMKVPGGMT